MIEYTVRPGDSFNTICTRFSRSQEVVFGLNSALRERPDRIRVGDIIVFPDVAEDDPDSSEIVRLPQTEGVASDPLGKLVVPRGQLTFDVEGSDRPGIFFSRVLHVPPGASGVTLGRGYDMKQRTRAQIATELASVGIESSVVNILQGASELTGRDARHFITRSSLDGFEITHAQQKALFLMAYDDLASDVRRICDKSDVVRIYGATDWAALDEALRDVVVDLRYRGDYHPTSRRGIQRYIAQNNLSAFTDVMCDRAFWIAVPEDRFQRRRDFLLVS